MRACRLYTYWKTSGPITDHGTDVVRRDRVDVMTIHLSRSRTRAWTRTREGCVVVQEYGDFCTVYVVVISNDNGVRSTYVVRRRGRVREPTTRGTRVLSRRWDY